MKRLLALATTALLTWGGMAQATTITVDWYATLATNTDTTAATVSWTPHSGTNTQNGGQSSVPLTTSPDAEYQFATINPQHTEFGGSCGNGSDCVGGIQTDTLTFTFHVSTNGGASYTTFNETGVFTADYNNSTLTCAGTDKPADCFIWNGSLPTLGSGVGSGSGTGTLTLNNILPGVTMILDNGFDWNAPIYAQFVDAPAPEPASLALLGFGLLGTLAAARRRRA